MSVFQRFKFGSKIVEILQNVAAVWIFFFKKLLLTIISLRYHGRWIDSVWKSRSHTDALKGNPINLYIF